MSDIAQDTDSARRLEARLNSAFQTQEREGLRLAAILRAVATAAIVVWLFILLRGGG
jgi:hypothetical protein